MQPINHKTLKCPNCKKERKADKYLYNKELSALVCCNCGILFMDIETAKQLLTVNLKSKNYKLIKDN